MHLARTIGGVWLAAGALALSAGLVPAGEIVVPGGPPGASAPAAEDCTILDFAKAELTGQAPDWRLHVTGTAPRRGLTIRLVPLMYVMQPEYWQVVLVGCTAGAPLAGSEPFDVTLPLQGSIGRKGVLLVGRSPANEQRFDLAR